MVELGGEAARQALLDMVLALGVPGLSIGYVRDSTQGIQATSVRVKVQKRERSSKSLAQIADFIGKAPVAKETSELALNIVNNLAQAESAVHGKPPSEIRFHTVGALDSVVDILGAALLVNHMRIDETYCLPVPLTYGSVKMSGPMRKSHLEIHEDGEHHKEMPAPAPATAFLLQGASVYYKESQKELVTPTGAAILKTIVKSWDAIPAVVVDNIAYGAGTMKLPWANVLRAYLCRRLEVAPAFTPSELVQTTAASPETRPSDKVPAGRVAKGERRGYLTDSLYLVSTNLDDISPEIVGGLIERLIEQGARDAWIETGIGKKSRPVMILNLLADEEKVKPLSDLLFTETSTFGIRIIPAERIILEREESTIRTSHGDIKIKIGKREGRIIKISPEYESLSEAARKKGVSIRQAEIEVNAAISRKFRFQLTRK